MRTYYEEIFSDYPDIVGIEDMRSMLGNLGRNTTYNLLKSNKIKHIRVGRKYKIPKKYIIDFLIESDSSTHHSG